MSVKIEGLGKLRANYYDKIVINQDNAYGNYSIKIKGEKIEYATERIGDRFSQEFKNKSEVEQISEIIKDYIENSKIYGFTDLINLPGYDKQRFNIVYGNFGYREMLLRLFNRQFNDVFRKIQQKYYQDRFDFCYEENDIKTFKISTSRTGSFYNMDFDKLHKGSKHEECFKHIHLREKNFAITDSEKKFIGNFVIDTFSKFGEEIQIEKVYNTEYDITINEVTGFIFKCGNVKIYIDRYEPLLFLLVIVGNYNLSLKYEKENYIKRQLRMEEF